MSEPQALDPEDKLTVREAAREWSVTYDTALSWVKKGVVPHIRVGPFKWIRIRRRDVQAQITEHRN